jgi:hypothetical protein
MLTGTQACATWSPTHVCVFDIHGHATNVCVLDMVARLCMRVCDITPSNTCVPDDMCHSVHQRCCGKDTRFHAFFGLLDGCRLAGLTWRAALPPTLRRRAVVLRGTREERGSVRKGAGGAERVAAGAVG